MAVNDAANENGELFVAPGDRLPGIPRHSFKLGGRYDVTSGWSVSLDGIVASSRVFVGDEGNDQVPLDGYTVVNLRSAYALNESLELFGRVDNLFDVDYSTFGVLAEVELVLEEAPDADDPRFCEPRIAPERVRGGPGHILKPVLICRMMPRSAIYHDLFTVTPCMTWWTTC